MFSSWREKWQKANEGTTVNDVPHWKVGPYLVKIEDGLVEYKNLDRSRNKFGDPRATFPDMTVDEEAIRIPIVDIVDIILQRSEPEDLARALWMNKEVREAFMDCMTQRYSSEITDDERRKFIKEVGGEVHSKALDIAIKRLSSLEHDARERHSFYYELCRVNDLLKQRGYVDGDDNPIKMKRYDDDPDFKIGAKHWSEARDDWRTWLKEKFVGTD